jgi:hypothetical protein
VPIELKPEGLELMAPSGPVQALPFCEIFTIMYSMLCISVFSVFFIYLCDLFYILYSLSLNCGSSGMYNGCVCVCVCVCICLLRTACIRFNINPLNHSAQYGNSVRLLHPAS